MKKMINLEVFRQTLKKFRDNRQAPNQAKKVEVVKEQPKNYFDRKVDTALVEFLRASVKMAADESVKQIICGLGIFQASKKETSEGAAVAEVTENNSKYIKALFEYSGGLVLKETTGGNMTQYTISAVTLDKITARLMGEYLLPPNCYDSDGIIKAATGKRYRYIDIFKFTSLPVEIKTAPENYFEWCHANLYNVLAVQCYHKVGLSPYEDVLKMGYDEKTREIIIPLNSQKYVSIGLNMGDYYHGWGYENKKSAMRILSHYNLQPYKNGESSLIRNSAGVVEYRGCNYDTPYLDNRFIGTDGEIIFAGCIGQVYHKINLPFTPSEEIKILQPYKI